MNRRAELQVASPTAPLTMEAATVAEAYLRLLADRGIETYLYSKSIAGRPEVGSIWHVDRHRRGK